MAELTGQSTLYTTVRCPLCLETIGLTALIEWSDPRTMEMTVDKTTVRQHLADAHGIESES